MSNLGNLESIISVTPQKKSETLGSGSVTQTSTSNQGNQALSPQQAPPNQPLSNHNASTTVNGNPLPPDNLGNREFNRLRANTVYLRPFFT